MVREMEAPAVMHSRESRMLFAARRAITQCILAQFVLLTFLAGPPVKAQTKAEPLVQASRCSRTRMCFAACPIVIQGLIG